MAEIGELPLGWSTFVSECEAECIPVAPDGMEQIAILYAVPPMESATSVSWSFIQDNPGGEIIYQAGTNSPFPNNHQMYVSTNGVVTPVSYPLGIASQSNMSNGIADRSLFGWSSSTTFHLFSLSDNSQIDFELSGHGFTDFHIRNWSVVGNTVFLGGQDLTDGDGDFNIAKYTYEGALGAFVATEDFSTLTGIVSLHFTGTFVYVFGVNSGAGTYTIFKYDPDFTLLDTFVLTVASIPSVTGFIGMYADSEDRVWLLSFLTSGLNGAYYVRDMTELVTVDAAIDGSGLVPIGSAYVIQVHEDSSTGTRYIYQSNSAGYPIYKYGPIVCAE
jgi:hypothetical protein